MSTESDAAVAAAVETTQTPPSEVAVSSVPERDFESEARKTGWRPKDDWGGDPDNWKDAETWVKRGQDIAESRKFDERLAKIERVNKATIKALQEQHAKDLAAVQQAKLAAVDSGDRKEYQRLEKIEEAIKADAPDVEDAPAAKEDIKALEAAWKEAHPWYDRKSPEYDEDMEIAANGYSQKLLDESEGKLPFSENLKKTEAYMRKKFPHKFAAANGHAAVDGGGAFPGAGKPDPLAKLPAEARAQAKSDMKTFPKIYPTADSWLKVYNAK